MIAPLVDHLWQSTLVALAAALLVFALRRHGASVRYWIWLAASLKFLVPFAALIAIGNTVEWRVATAEPAPASGVTQWIGLAGQVAAPVATLVPAVAPAVVPAARDDRVAFAALVGAVWLGGAALVLGVWFARGLRLSRIVRLATPLSGGSFARLGIDARLSSAKIEPGIVGIFRPVLLLPDGILQRLSAAQLEAVIAHEVCHVRRRDNLTAAAHMAVAAVFWFHPLVWWIGARLAEERERACDEAVLAAGTDPDAYAEGILGVCRLYLQSPLPCAAGVGGGTTLKARVQKIAENRAVRRLGSAWGVALAAAASIAVGAPFAIGVLTAPSVAAQAADGGASAISRATIEAGADTRGFRIRMASGVLTTLDYPLRELIAFAYDLQDYEVAGPPDLDSRRYSIHATTDSDASTADYRRLMRGLLEQRFGLESHVETRRLPVLVLRRSSDELGPSLVRVAAGIAGTGTYSRREARAWIATNQPMRSLTSWLSNALRMPVLDETGLREAYSFDVRWESSAPDDALAQPTLDELTPALESQLGLSLTESQRRVELRVVDRITEPSNPLTAKTAVTLPAEALDSRVGYYGVLARDWIVTVRRDGDHLVAEPFGEEPLTLYPLDETRFFTPNGEVDVTFAAGRTAGLVLSSAMSERSAPRLNAAAARARLAALNRKIELQEPAPGGEEIVRGIARGLANEDPVRSVTDFTGQLRDAVRAAAPAAFARRGALRSVTFKGVAPTARDVYEVAFENLTFEVLLGVDDAGKITSLNHRLPVTSAETF